MSDCAWCGAEGAQERDEAGDPCCLVCLLAPGPDNDLDENTERLRAALRIQRACWHVDHGDC